MHAQFHSKLTPKRRSPSALTQRGISAFAWTIPLVESSLPPKESIVWHFAFFVPILPSWAFVHPEAEAGYGALLPISETSFEFCQWWAHLTLREERNIIVAKNRARSSFPQDGRELSTCEGNRMELEGKTDCRYWRERDKCRIFWGTTSCRDLGLGLNPSQSWRSCSPCQGLAWEWACDSVRANELGGEVCWGT